jgi:hypothetical protein
MVSKKRVMKSEEKDYGGNDSSFHNLSLSRCFLSFVGGMDFSLWSWDTPSRVRVFNDNLRRSPDDCGGHRHLKTSFTVSPRRDVWTKVAVILKTHAEKKLENVRKVESEAVTEFQQQSL